MKFKRKSIGSESLIVSFSLKLHTLDTHLINEISILPLLYFDEMSEVVTLKAEKLQGLG